MKHSDPRPPVVGTDDGPESPFPLRLEGPVVKGFGRGSKELGIPTANIPIEGLSVAGHTDLESGVYFGFCSLKATEHSESNGTTSSSGITAGGSTGTTSTAGASQRGVVGAEAQVYEMVMSIGWNPFYKNTVRSVEVHVMHDFKADFYGAHLKLLILGFMRDELDYVSREALIEDIQTDIRIAKQSLTREKWSRYGDEDWLKS